MTFVFAGQLTAARTVDTVVSVGRLFDDKFARGLRAARAAAWSVSGKR
jgi:hypothetical protein